MTESKNDDESVLMELEEQLKSNRRQLLTVAAVGILSVVAFVVLGSVMQGEKTDTEMATKIGGIRAEHERLVACLLPESLSAQNWGEVLFARLTLDSSSRDGVQYCLEMEPLDRSFTAEERERYASVEPLASALAEMRRLREVLQAQPSDLREEAQSICSALVALSEGFNAIEDEINVPTSPVRDIDCEL